MIYNFQSWCVPLVLSGAKQQTIRPLGKRRAPRPGEALELYTGLRTRRARKIMDALCTQVDAITIEPISLGQLSPVIVNGVRISHAEVDALGHADGFLSTGLLFAALEQIHGLPFCGRIIHWLPA